MIFKIGLRIKELRMERGISQNQLAKKAGISQAGLSAIESTTKNPSMQTLQLLANALDVPVAQLTGDMPASFDNVSSLIPSSAGGIRIPVLGDVAAGIPIEAITDIIDYEEIPVSMAKSGDYFGLRVKGKSMEPQILEGDVVIVRKQHDVESNDIAVVLVNGDSATVKRVKKREDGIVLIPFNPLYDPMYYSTDEISSLPVSIIGKVVELRRKF